jgi:hypothetical protein
LQKRGEPMTVANQRANVAAACAALAPVALEHELVISHANGPQVGLLALQASAFDEVSPYPFDVLGAQTEGMIGYLIEQELGNLLPFEKPLATILTMTEVDPADQAFDDPTKFVGAVYSKDEAPACRGTRLGGQIARIVEHPLDQNRGLVRIDGQPILNPHVITHQSAVRGLRSDRFLGRLVRPWPTLGHHHRIQALRFAACAAERVGYGQEFVAGHARDLPCDGLGRPNALPVRLHDGVGFAATADHVEAGDPSGERRPGMPDHVFPIGPDSTI